MTLAYLTPIQAGGKEGGLGVSAIVIDQLRNELNRMLSMARDNVADSFRAVLARDQEQLVQVEQREEYIDFLNREISRYVSHLISIETNEQGSAVVSSFFTMVFIFADSSMITSQYQAMDSGSSLIPSFKPSA